MTHAPRIEPGAGRATRLRFAAALAVGLLALPCCGHDVRPTDAYRDPASIPVPGLLTVAQLGEGDAFLEWEEDDAVFAVIDGWHVYRATITGSVSGARYRRLTVAPTPFRNFIDRAVVRDSTYAYQVRAMSPAGVEGFPGNTAVLTVDLNPPEPPSGLAGSARVLGPEDGCPPGFFCAKATLTWEPSPSSDVAEYRLYRVPPFPIGDFVAWPFLTFEDTSIEPDVVYRYSLSAIDFSANESVRTGELEVILPVP